MLRAKLHHAPDGAISIELSAEEASRLREDLREIARHVDLDDFFGGENTVESLLELLEES